MDRKAQFTAVGVTIALCAVIIALTMLLDGGKTAASASSLEIRDGYYTIAVNGEERPFEGRVFICGGITYVPADILRYCGYESEYDEENGIIYLTGIKQKKLTEHIGILDGDNPCGKKEFLRYGGKPYITLYTYEKLSRVPLTITGNPPERELYARNTMQDTVITDEFRLSEEQALTRKDITVADGRGMECIKLSEKETADYADIINGYAEAVPEAEVYSLVVPTSAEFYAPKELYPHQTEAIRRIYESYTEAVTPVNVTDALSKHADEYIYFLTDHHWTQRGAYYAYRTFADLKGMGFGELWEFEKTESKDFYGSFAKILKGTSAYEQLDIDGDVLEKYYPHRKCSICVYNDMYMKMPAAEIGPFNDKDNTYSAFLYGDTPLTVINTGLDTGKSLAVIKDSYGNAFSLWAASNYDTVYVIDPRGYDGYNKEYESFNLRKFYELVKFDDLLVVNYPGSIKSDEMRAAMRAMN